MSSIRIVWFKVRSVDPYKHGESFLKILQPIETIVEKKSITVSLSCGWRKVRTNFDPILKPLLIGTTKRKAHRHWRR